MNEYEILLMLDPDLPEERQTEIVTRIRELVERGEGTWVRQDAWGRRKLAFEIQKKTDGVLRHMAVHRVRSSQGPGRPATAEVPEPDYAAANVRSQEEE